MKLADKRFWIAWGVSLILMVGCCLRGELQTRPLRGLDLQFIEGSEGGARS